METDSLGRGKKAVDGCEQIIKMGFLTLIFVCMNMSSLLILLIFLAGLLLFEVMLGEKELNG